MAHNTLDGATAIARQRRQHKQLTGTGKCQDPRCCQNKQSTPKQKSKSRRSKNGQNSSKSANMVNFKSAPSSPVGTSRKLVNMTQNVNYYHATRKKELNLDPQWITAFPTVETPSESGFPLNSGKLTGRIELEISITKCLNNA